MRATQIDGTFRNALVERQHIKLPEKAPRRSFEAVIGADHHFHPGDDADCLVRVASKLGRLAANHPQLWRSGVRSEALDGKVRAGAETASFSRCKPE